MPDWKTSLSKLSSLSSMVAAASAREERSRRAAIFVFRVSCRPAVSYSLCKELFRLPPIGRSSTRRHYAVDPIVLLSVSAEDRAMDDQKRPRRSSTVALDVLSQGGARRSSPSTLPSAWRHLLVQHSCAVLAHAVMASSATCWAVAPAPGALHPAEKSARCARAEAPRLCFVVGRRHDHRDGFGGCGCMCATPERGKMDAPAFMCDV